MIEPRDYQLQAVDGVFDYWNETPGCYPLVSMSTGGGKSIVLALLVKRVLDHSPDMDVLVCVHRKEIIEQLESAIMAVWPDAPVGVLAAGLKRNEIKQITVASRDTIATRLDKPAMADYSPSLVIIDECHLIPTKDTSRYQKMINELKSRSNNFMLVGFTATPFRATSGLIYGPADDQIFDGLAFKIGMRELIKRNRLWPVKTLETDKAAKIDTSDIKLVNGDFHQKQLAEASNQHHLVQAAIADWYKQAYTQGRKHTLFFCSSIAHCESVHKELLSYGITVPVVTGKTLPEVRAAYFEGVRNRTLIGLIGVGVFTEGTDLVTVDCIVLLRAVYSLGLYIQMIGRLMRIDPECEHDKGLVLDYTGTVERLGPIDIAQPAGRRNSVKTPRTKVCPKCKTVIGFFRVLCDPPCEHRFAPKYHKVCPECKTENDPKALECINCGQLWIKHNASATSSALLSDENQYQKLIVYDISSQLKSASESGGIYLRVLYHTEALHLDISRSLCLGYEGAAGEHAQNMWRRMVRDDIDIMIPRTAEQANMIGINWQQQHWRPVESVVIDRSDDFRRIVMVNYLEPEVVNAATA